MRVAGPRRPSWFGTFLSWEPVGSSRFGGLGEEFGCLWDNQLEVAIGVFPAIEGFGRLGGECMVRGGQVCPGEILRRVLTSESGSQGGWRSPRSCHIRTGSR